MNTKCFCAYPLLVYFQVAAEMVLPAASQQPTQAAAPAPPNKQHTLGKRQIPSFEGHLN